MMKKIGIITLYQDNFGSILQAYATYFFIESLGNECNILRFNYLKSRIDKIMKIPVILYKSIKYRGYLKDREKIKISAKKERILLSLKTKELMDKFINSIFKIEVCNAKTLGLLNNEYDYFITGSDQVWNGYDKFRFLTFADKEKRIALAPSFGTDSIKPYIEHEVREALEGFKGLTTREESGVDIIKKLTGKKAERLADPTLLFNKEEWSYFALKGIKKTNYILLHFLNKPNDIAFKVINEYIKENDCMVYCICNQYKEYEQLTGSKFIDINPYDYVSLIENANCVFTDSFHSTLFSLNLETQFYTFERQYFHQNTQKSRIVDLLNRVGMMDRFITNEQGFDARIVGIWKSDILFYEERTKLKNYIKKMLG